MNEHNRFVGDTAIQIVVDRFFRSGDEPKPISGRILKKWHDRMPNWFPDSNGDYKNDFFYGGNLKGIEEKLDYLKSLGFTLIYMTPIEESVSYHHYDVGNQSKIDPWIGEWKDLASLCNAATEKGIKIIVDLVFNHTGVNSDYFNNPRCKSWYKRDANGNPVFWWGFRDLAEVDTTNLSYEQEMEGVIEKYFSCGVSGVRFDLGEGLSKEFFNYVAKAKEKYPESIYIGEMWGIATDKADPKIFDGQLDSVMNYPMSDAILRWCAFGNNEHFIHNFKRVYTEYPKNVQNVLLNNVATHDTPLTMTMLADIKLHGEDPVMNPDVFNGSIWDIEGPWRNSRGGFDTYGFRLFEAKHDSLTPTEYELAKKLTKVALTLLYAIPGIPCVMQGTEIGDSGFKDPFCRKPYNWDNQDKELQMFVSLLGKIRSENSDCLAEGDVNLAYASENVIILERYDMKGHRIVVCVSRSKDAQTINIHNDCEGLKIMYATGNSNKHLLDPYGIVIAREN